MAENLFFTESELVEANWKKRSFKYKKWATKTLKIPIGCNFSFFLKAKWLRL